MTMSSARAAGLPILEAVEHRFIDVGNDVTITSSMPVVTRPIRGKRPLFLT
jgi:hypothetical protein